MSSDPKLDEILIPKNENQEKKFWNGSIDELKQRIEMVNDEEKKIDFKNKLNCILHLAHRKGPEDSTVFDHVRYRWYIFIPYQHDLHSAF